MLNGLYNKVLELVNKKSVTPDQARKIDPSINTIYNNVLDDTTRYLVRPQKPTFTLTPTMYQDGKSGVLISISPVIMDENGGPLRFVSGVYDATIAKYVIQRASPVDLEDGWRTIHIINLDDSASAQSLSYNDHDIRKHATYRYRVAVYDRDGRYNYSNMQVIENITDNVPPAIPENEDGDPEVYATANGHCYNGSRNIKVWWIPPNDNDYSHTTVEYRLMTESDWLTAGVSEVSVDTASVYIRNTLPINYAIRVRHWDYYNNYSEVVLLDVFGDDIVKPKAPNITHALTRYIDGVRSIQISFNQSLRDSENVFDVMEYVVSRKGPSNNSSGLAALPFSKSGIVPELYDEWVESPTASYKYEDENVEAGKWYRYRVLAKDKKGNKSEDIVADQVDLQVWPDEYAPVITFDKERNKEKYNTPNIRLYFNIADPDVEIHSVPVNQAITQQAKGTLYYHDASGNKVVVGNPYTFAYTTTSIVLSGIPSGTKRQYYFQISVTDRVGLTATETYSFMYDNTRIINSVVANADGYGPNAVRLRWQVHCATPVSETLKTVQIFVRENSGSFVLVQTIDAFSSGNSVFATHIYRPGSGYAQSVNITFKVIAITIFDAQTEATSNTVATAVFRYTDIDPTSTILGVTSSAGHSQNDLRRMYDNKRYWTGTDENGVPTYDGTAQLISFTTGSNRYVQYDYKFSKTISRVNFDVHNYNNISNIRLSWSQNGVNWTSTPLFALYDPSIHPYRMFKTNNMVIAARFVRVMFDCSTNVSVYECNPISEIVADHIEAGTIHAVHIAAKTIKAYHIDSIQIKAEDIISGRLYLGGSLPGQGYLQIHQQGGTANSTCAYFRTTGQNSSCLELRQEGAPINAEPAVSYGNMLVSAIDVLSSAKGCIAARGPLCGVYISRSDGFYPQYTDDQQGVPGNAGIFIAGNADAPSVHGARDWKYGLYISRASDAAIKIPNRGLNAWKTIDVSLAHTGGLSQSTGFISFRSQKIGTTHSDNNYHFYAYSVDGGYTRINTRSEIDNYAVFNSSSTEFGMKINAVNNGAGVAYGISANCVDGYGGIFRRTGFSPTYIGGLYGIYTASTTNVLGGLWVSNNLHVIGSASIRRMSPRYSTGWQRTFLTNRTNISYGHSHTLNSQNLVVEVRFRTKFGDIIKWDIAYNCSFYTSWISIRLIPEALPAFMTNQKITDTLYEYKIDVISTY